MQCPTFEEFTFHEKMLISKLHSRYGDNWKEIAKHVPHRTPLLIKIYWLKKQRNERYLQTFLCQKDLLSPLNKKSALDILALVAMEELE